MIIITVNGYCIDIEGHAEAAPYGQDIVCASVSALFCTLSGGLSAYEEMFEMPSLVYSKSGYAHFECRPLPNAQETVDAVWNIFLSGLQTIAIQYPGHVKFIRNKS